MRGFFYILALTGVLLLNGHAAQAKSQEDILAGLANQDAAVSIEQLEGIMSKLDSEVGLDNLNGLLQKAVDKHPQLAELVLIMQEYGVLTDIKISDKQREAFRKKLAARQ